MNKRGFTLVEIIVSLSIFAILLSSMYYIFGVELRLWQRYITASEDLQISNMVMTKITRDIRAADKIISSSSDQLSLKVETDTIQYSFSKGKVKRKKNSRSSYLTTKGDLSALSFASLSDKLVEIKINDFSTKIVLRNKK